jgi:hypothetical protein
MMSESGNKAIFGCGYRLSDDSISFPHAHEIPRSLYGLDGDSWKQQVQVLSIELLPYNAPRQSRLFFVAIDRSRRSVT